MWLKLGHTFNQEGCGLLSNSMSLLVSISRLDSLYNYGCPGSGHGFFAEKKIRSKFPRPRSPCERVEYKTRTVRRTCPQATPTFQCCICACDMHAEKSPPAPAPPVGVAWGQYALCSAGFKSAMTRLESSTKAEMMVVRT